MTQAHIEASNVALAVLEAIRATNPELIADNMPPGWGMNKLRASMNGRPQLAANELDCVVGGYTLKARLDGDNHLSLFVSHSDGSPVLDIGEDIAVADNEFAVRLTTQDIENQWCATGH